MKTDSRKDVVDKQIDNIHKQRGSKYLYRKTNTCIEKERVRVEKEGRKI